jgi:transposase
MVLLGVDPHKDTHTVVAVDQVGRPLDQTTVTAHTRPYRTAWLGNSALG